MSATGRVIAIDPGTVRIGLAISDERGLLATPLETVPARPPELLLRRLDELIASLGVTTLVVGLPLDLDGSTGRAARAALKLIERLERLTSCAVEPWDERMTSVLAERALRDGSVRRERRREVVDQIAATLILQSWLDARHARHPAALHGDAPDRDDD